MTSTTASSTGTPVPLANLFIKNLPGHIDDKMLHDLFSSYGAISSAKVIRREDGRSKEYGFVCFGIDWKAAFMAMANMNGRLVEGKPIYINIAQKKEQRKRILVAQYGKAYQEDHEMLEDHKPENTAGWTIRTKEESDEDRKRAIVRSMKIPSLYPTMADRIEREMMSLREGELYKIMANTDRLKEKIDAIANSIISDMKNE